MNPRVSIYLLTLLLLFQFSCKKDEDEKKTGNTVISQGEGVFIVNEGNFQWGNASVSYYDFGSQKLTEDIYKEKNDLPLGDVCQSMTLHEGKYYIVMNNSQKVEVVDAGTFVRTGQFKGLPSPRYLLVCGKDKAYVSDLYAHAISVLKLSSGQVLGRIPLQGWTEQMLLHDGKVLVTNLKSKYLYRINPLNDLIEDSLYLGHESSAILHDGQGRVWVMCSRLLTRTAGNSYLLRLNASVSVVDQVINLGEGAALGFNKSAAGDYLYWLNKGVYRFSVSSSTAPASPFISLPSANLYGLGVHPVNGDLYVGDAIDYVQKGLVKVYTANGVFKQEFRAGIMPSQFYFN